MVLFDPSDVPLHIAKMFKYVSDVHKSNFFATCADIAFGVFMLSFFFLRLFLYPYVVWSAVFEGPRYGVAETGETVCQLCLVLLLFLNISWGHMILKVLYKLIKTGYVEDDRSDDEDEGDQNDKLDDSKND